MPGTTSTRWPLEDRPERGEDFVHQQAHIDRRDRGRPLGHDSHRGQDRVHQPVEPLDLLERRPMPRGARLAARQVARLAAAQRRLVGKQVGIGADDGQRRAQLMGHEGDQLAARLIDRLERLDPRLGLRLLTALLDDPGEQVRDRAELRHVLVAERPPPLGLDIEDADDLVVPGERDGQHRGDEAALVDAADPQEAGVGLDVGDHQRSALGGDAAGHALAERDARPADLVAVEAVRGGQRQVRSVAVEQIERGDIRVEHVARPVDDGLEQLVPRPRGRGEARDLVQEAELLELVGRSPGRHDTISRTGRAGGWGRGRDARHRHHHTSLRNGCGREGCGAVVAGARNGPRRWPA